MPFTAAVRGGGGGEGGAERRDPHPPERCGTSEGPLGASGANPRRPMHRRQYILRPTRGASGCAAHTTKTQ